MHKPYYFNFQLNYSGESASIFEDYFLLMPDPYLKARRNRLEWVAEYLDQELCQEGDVVTSNSQEGPLALASTPYLGPGEELRIALRRSDKVSQGVFKVQIITRLISVNSYS